MPPSTGFTRKSFGRAVRRRREQLGWSQEDFAERAGIHRTYVSSIELGKVRVGIEVANELAKALNMRLSSLVRLSEEFELKVLVDEFLTSCDDVTRDMFYRRVRGFSWKEIGKVHGISSHAAESRFGQALQRVRKKLNLR